MTLILGIRCTDGIVMAADSMSTEAAPGDGHPITRGETDKKLVLQQHFVWGCAGSVGIKQEIEQAISAHYQTIYQHKDTPVAFRQKLCRVIGPVMTEAYQRFIQLPPRPHIPTTDLLVGGYIGGAFFLVGVERNMDGEVVEACHCAVGSGMKTGQALLRRLRHQVWDVKTGLVVAYRTMLDAIHVEPGGIGPPIRLVRCILGKESKPSVERLGDDELRTIESAAMAWLKVEQEAMGNLGSAAEDKVAAPPKA